MIKIDVLTYCSGYSFEVYDRFIGTLNDTGYSGTIYIIVQEKDIQVMSQILKKYDKNVRVILDNKPRTTHFYCHRYLIYKEFLELNRINSDYILICDSRDVLFQKNIENYSFDLETDIYCFAEDIKIKNETLCNIHWLLEVERTIKDNFYESIKDNMVLCAGTSIMKLSALKGYILLMCDIITRYNITSGIDQGIHNYLIYTNKLKNYKIKILENKDNLVNTVGFGFKKVKDGKIVNELDEISYVVHQFDRFSNEMLLGLDKKYNFLCK
jgi:hypothetical protein